MVASKNELALTTEHVNQILELRLPESVFYRRVSVSGKNGKASSLAGCLNKRGYTVIGINGNLFYVHRLVWFLTYGKFPEGVIDHIDGDKSNNRVENLRDVTRTVNNQNRTKQNRVDTDLPTGVFVGWYNKFGETTGYRAQWYSMNGKYCQAYFGIREYYTLEAALAAAVARRELEIGNLKDLGAAYTERHGV